jgi:hypothetical protein
VIEAMAPQITNTDLLLYAMYRLGGAGKYVDVEDVFMEMWRLAPARFSWRKYRQPNYKIMSQAIADLTRREEGSDLLLGAGDTRQLSAQGVRYVESRIELLQRFATGEEKAPPDRRPSQRVIAELAKQPLVREHLRGEGVDLNRDEMAELLRCAPDSPRSVWRERLETLRAAAADGDRPELTEFLDQIERANPTWFAVSR